MGAFVLWVVGSTLVLTGVLHALRGAVPVAVTYVALGFAVGPAGVGLLT